MTRFVSATVLLICSLVHAAAAADNSSDLIQISVPEQIKEVEFAEGGRSLVLRLGTPHKLAVFDIATAKIISTIDIPYDNFLYAAGRTKLMVLSRDQSRLVRFDLSTGQRELTTEFPGVGAFALTMGCNSEGPLMISIRREGGGAGSSESDLINIRSMQKLDYDGINAPGWMGGGVIVPESISASDDGRTFVGWGFPYGAIRLLRVGTSSAKSQYVPSGDAVICAPTSNGQYIVTNCGILDSELQMLSDTTHPEEHYLDRCSIAAQGADFYIHWQQTADRKYHYSLCSTRERKTLFDLPVYPELKVDAKEALRTVHFCPLLRTLMTIGKAGVTLRRLDIEAELKKINCDYLYVLSEAPSAVVHGNDYLYNIQAISNHSNIRFSLETGPAGMTVSPSGQVNWKVPPELRNSIVGVIVHVQDSGEAECWHDFSISVN